MDDGALGALELIRERAQQRAATKKWLGNPENLAGIDLDLSQETPSYAGNSVSIPASFQPVMPPSRWATSS